MKIAVIGHGRAGKDVFASELSRITGLRCGGSVSLFVRDRVAKVLGLDPEEAWNTRHAMRERWKAIIDDFRKDDPGCILREMLEVADIIPGIRARAEFEAVSTLFDHIVWVDRDVPRDPTLELNANDATDVILNRGTLATFHSRIQRFADSIA